jgi:hypothetical protein
MEKGIAREIGHFKTLARIKYVPGKAIKEH